MSKTDAIAELGHCAAVCELEAHLCPWERTNLEVRAAAYRGEQLRLLAQLAAPADSKALRTNAQLKRFEVAVFLGCN